MKKRIFSILFCLCMVAVLLPTTALAATFNPATDTEISNFSDLQEALGAGNGGTYTLTANINVDSTLTLSSGSLTINGGGHTITYTSSSATITNNGNLTIKNLTINGNQKGGRCISNNAGTLNMEKVTLTGASLRSNSDVSTKGAGLYNAANATAILTDCNICDNINDGNQYRNGYGGGFYNDGTLIMENCAIVENNAAATNNVFGGGGYNFGTLYMNNCTVANNQSGSNGGGIYQSGPEAKTYLMNCTVTGNIAARDSGGIYINNGSLYAVNSVFAFNYNSSALQDIYRYSGSATLYSCAYGAISYAVADGNCKSLTTATVTDLFNAADSESSTYARPAVTEFTKDGFTSYGVYLKDGSALTSGGTATYYKRTGSTVQMSYGSENTPLVGLTAADKNEDAVTTYQDGTTRAASVIGALSSPPPHTHCICGAAHSDVGDHTAASTQTFTAWDTTNSLPDAAGYYYLTKDVTLTGTWKPADGVVLCLNGHTITADGDFDCIQVTSNSYTLTLCDCKPNGIEGCITHSSGTGHGVNTAGTFNMYGGTISGNTAGASDSGGGGVYVNGTFNMYGGTISGNKTAGSTIGGGVYVASGKTFTMNGGTITGNTANSGGGVYVVSSGNFNMNSGTITGNTADNSGGGVCSVGTFKMTGGTIGDADNAANKAKNGGGVYVGSGSTFEMSGGEITGNTATYNGGGVYVNGGTFTMSGGTIGGTATGAANTAQNGGGVYVSDGTFEMSGTASITGNTATLYGGGVYVDTGGAFKMSGTASITGNKADYIGGGVFSGGTFEMSGGSITDNTATYKCGGVYVDFSSTMTVSGGVNITGNKKGDDANNVYLPSNNSVSQTITITGALTNDASIGVTKTISGTTPVTIAQGETGESAYTITSGDANHFFPDAGSDYIVTLNGDNTISLKAHQHSWSYTAAGATITAICNNNTECGITDETLTISAPEHATYGDGKEEAAKLTYSNGNGTVGGVTPTVQYAVKDGDSLDTPPTNAGTYKASITVGEAEAYVTYTISQKEVTNPTIEVGSAGAYDGTAKTPAVTVKDSGTTIDPGEYTVTYANNTKAGTASVTITDNAGGNYTVNGSTTFTIAKGTQTITVPTGASIIKNGVAVDISNWASVAGAAGGTDPGALSYELVGTPAGVTLTKVDQTYQLKAEPSATASPISIKVTAAETDNYEKAEKTFEVTVNAKTPAALTVTQTGWTYGDATVTPGYTKPDGTIDSTIKVTYAVKDSSTFGEAVPTNAGDYTVKVVLETAEKIYSGTADFTISPATMSGITATGHNGTYDGNPHGITVNIPAEYTSATVEYGTTEGSYTLSISPTYTAAGSYTVFYKVSKANYNDVTGSATVNIFKATMTGITATPYSGTFDNHAHGIEVSGPVGATVMYGTTEGNYSSSDNPTYADAGTYTVYYKVTKDNYEDFTGSATVTIEPKSIDGAAVGAFDSMTYTGSAQTPRAAVTIGSLTATGTWSQVTNVTDTTTFTASGNFTGTISGKNPGMAQKIVDALALNNVVTAPSKNGTPQTSVSHAQYTGTVSWAPADTPFLGGKVYTATLTLEATSNYTFTGVTANSFTYTGATVTNAADSGAVTITFPATSNAAVSSIAIKTPATKTTYLVGDSLDVTGLVITATMDDSTTRDENVTAGMVSGFDSSAYAQSQTLTITYDGKTTTYNITVNKLDQSAPETPTMASKDSGSVTLNAITTPGQGAVEYAKNTADTAPADGWQTDPTFTGLDPDTTYYFFARYAGSDTYNPAVSAYAEIKTDPAPVVISTYTVAVADSANGTVTSSADRAARGSTVTLTVKADEGYALSKLTVTSIDGQDLTLTDKGDGAYTFTMPAGKVTVTAVFAAKKCDGGDNCATHGYTDIDTSEWYHTAVDYVITHDMMSGFGGGVFSPDGTFDRAMMVQVLYNLEKKPETALSDFTDLVSGMWYVNAVNWAATNGIAAGYGSTFGPETPITREQVAQFLYNFARFKGYDLTARADLTQFVDGDKTSDWAQTAMQWAVASGILGGKGGKVLDPTATATRAEVAQMLMSFCEKVAK